MVYEKMRDVQAWFLKEAHFWMLSFLAERNEQEEIKNNNGKLSRENSETNYNLSFKSIEKVNGLWYKLFRENIF